jgi:Pyruvate/2-oxoacid:ferredoxin oxidoreductase delta subunit
MNELSTLRVLELAIPLLAAVVAWFVNESRKRAWDEYERKETNYKALLSASRGFYAAQDTKKKADFLEQVDLCWLYCPDEVIRRAYGFLETTKTGAQSTEAQRAQAFGQLVQAIRKDLLKRHITRRTSLTADDYRLFKAN